MTRTQEYPHSRLLTFMYLLSVLLLVLADCASFVRTGTVTQAETALTILASLGLIFYGSKL